MSSVEFSPLELGPATTGPADTTDVARAALGRECAPLRPVRVSPRLLKAWLVFADLAAFVLGILTAVGIQWVVKPIYVEAVGWHLVLAAASAPAFAAAAFWNRLYVARAIVRPAEEAGRVIRTVLAGAAALVALSVAVKFDALSRLWVVLVVLTVTGFVLVERRVVRRLFAKLRRSGRLRRRILIVGTDVHALGLLHSYQRDPSLGYEVVGFVGDDDLGDRGGVTVVGPVRDVSRLLAEHDATGVVVSLPGVGADEVNGLTRRLTDQGYHVALSSSLRDIDIGRLRPQELDGLTLIYVERTVRSGWRAIAKRAFDVTGAVAILAFSMPVLIVAALAIKVSSPGPVLFRQERVGRNRVPFQLYKLRSMVVDAESQLDELLGLNEADGPIFKIKRDPRITRVGAFLRKCSIDELPQLFCVLRGTMSLVGPRPMLPAEAEASDPGVVEERTRVLPGLTGLWQVSGRSESSFEEYCRLDQYYVDNWTLGHDVQICLRTVGVVVLGKGAM